MMEERREQNIEKRKLNKKSESLPEMKGGRREKRTKKRKDAKMSEAKEDGKNDNMKKGNPEGREDVKLSEASKWVMTANGRRGWGGGEGTGKGREKERGRVIDRKRREGKEEKKTGNKKT